MARERVMVAQSKAINRSGASSLPQEPLNPRIVPRPPLLPLLPLPLLPLSALTDFPRKDLAVALDAAAVAHETDTASAYRRIWAYAAVVIVSVAA